MENDAILRKIILDEIQSFESIIRSSLEKSKKINVNVCSKEECSELLKNINDLKDITSQATKSTEDLNGEIQALRLTLYEAFAMSAEAQSKIDLLNNPRYACRTYTFYQLQISSKVYFYLFAARTARVKKRI